MSTVLEAHGVGVAWSASLPVLKDVSFVLTPSQNVALGDDDAARSFARRYLVPPLLGLAG